MAKEHCWNINNYVYFKLLRLFLYSTKDYKYVSTVDLSSKGNYKYNAEKDLSS